MKCGVPRLAHAIFQAAMQVGQVLCARGISRWHEIQMTPMRAVLGLPILVPVRAGLPRSESSVSQNSVCRGVSRPYARALAVSKLILKTRPPRSMLPIVPGATPLRTATSLIDRSSSRRRNLILCMYSSLPREDGNNL